jgi:hypothetical protein
MARDSLLTDVTFELRPVEMWEEACQAQGRDMPRHWGRNEFLTY